MAVSATRTRARAGLDRRRAPVIACFNRAKSPLSVNLDRLLAALQRYVDVYLAPVWGTPARIVKTNGFIKHAWAMVFLDDAANVRQGELAYHNLTPNGLPIAKVFVRTTLANGEKVSVAASHELAEMLIDPGINLMSTGPGGRRYAYESSDPVEQEAFLVNGIPMCDFVYPAYFETFRKPHSTRFDHLNKVSRPFQILPGGYQLILRNGKWHPTFGSAAKRRRFRKEDRREHRSALRGQRLRPVRSRRWGRILARY